jgi:phospholipid/cholesterol/gamma-HCH transport system substrate-binding protein
MLEGERGDLAASLHNLGIAMRQVSGFVRDNREVLGKNISGLDQVTQILVKQRTALAETLRDAPLALNNLLLTYNPQAGTLDTRANLGEIGHQLTSDPATFLCSILDQADTGGQACGAVRQVLGRNRPGAHARHPGPTSYDRIDPSLAGLVEAGR